MSRRIGRRRFLLAGAAGALALPAAPAVWRYLQSTSPGDATIPEYTGAAASLQELEACAPFDVCVVGSGPAGAVVGIQLARAGVRTLIVEAGVNPSAMASEPRVALLNQGEATGDLPYPLTASRMLAPGGTTSLWTGNTPRLLPLDFEHNAYTPEQADWPVRYADLEPYHCRAERTLGVAGDSDAPFAAPRSCGLPYEIDGGRNPNLRRVLARAGVQGVQTFRSRSLHGGPIRVARDLLPVFTRQANAVFAPGIVARRFLAGRDGTITSVLLENDAGSRHELRARCFVLAAGGVESARRLLLSRSEAFPEGIGNHSGLAGRTFSDHPTLQFRGIVPDVRHRPGELPETMRSFHFYEAFKRRGLGSVYLAMTLRDTDPPGPHAELGVNVDVELWPSLSNRVLLDESAHDAFGDPATRLHLSASDRDRATFAAARDMVRDLYARAGAKRFEEEPMKWSYHHLGTVRMGAEPRTSVVDPDLKVHGTRNLYVVTSGNFVTPGVSNPTLLIVALAYRLAPHLVSRLRAGAFASMPA